jgi:outer membrane protein OmpU
LKAVAADSHKAGKEAVAAIKDATSAQNRMRFSFKGTGETDGGISFGVSGRFEQSNSSTAGSQFVSGAFGKISMGDLDGADESAAGGGVSGVGLTGLSDTNDFAYASSSHNLGYEYSASGITFGYSTNTAVTTGSNSAFGLKYTGDMGGATVTIGLGQAKIGTATQGSMSASVSTGGLTIKAITSTNDNGPARKVAAEKAMVTTAGSEVVYAGDVTAKAAPDTDQTGVSISYAMDAMSVTAFTKTVSTSGAKDMDYSGFGFTYDLGGVTLKAGVVDNNDQQLMDFGVSFSF